MGIRFTNDEAKAMAVYVAQLTREGIAYTVADTSDGWVITATGF